MIAGKRFCLGVLAVLLLVTTQVGAAERAPRVQAAIDRGVAFLKGIQQTNGWVYDVQGNTGMTALVGLTLLECGVPANDPAVKKAAEIVRQYAPSLLHTYSLSISIWFFDAMGEEADVPLIESMAVRLLAGQKAEGGWRYTCPQVSPDEERRLTDLLKQRNVLKGSKELPKQGKAKEQGKRRQISPEIQKQLEKLVRPVAPAPQIQAGVPGANMDLVSAGERSGDNSNTQFAVLGLWVARRYGMPVDDALAKVESRFRKTQLTDGPQIGGWEYIPGGGANIPAAWSLPPAMTCSGLIGLAVGHGLVLDAAKEGKVRKHIDPDKDKYLKAAFMNLGWWLNEFRNLTTIGGKYFYFLWSLERVAEVYGMDTIGKKDWYAWGSNLLLRNQGADGGWHGEYDRGGADTCFALLFLARANVAKDLTVSLRNKFKDPGMHALKAGGVDPATLQKKGVKVAGSDKKPPDIPKLVEPKTDKSRGDGRDVRPTPAADTEDEEARTARKKSDELINAPAGKQEELLEQYKQSKGAVYTLALAGAIPKLSAETKAKARDALAERLTRMTAATLRAELKNDDPEIRRAASLACAMKDDKAHIPDLIPLLEDPQPLVSRAAHVALKSLSNQDFGPDKDATDSDRAKAVADWKAWWQKQGTGEPGKR